MDYLKQYRSFINSHYLNDGVRMTVAVLAPVLLFAWYNRLDIGLAIALGSLCVSITDNPGPINHRRNGLLVCNLLVFVVALVAGLTQSISWLFMIVLPVACFIFSLIGVYGARATGIGLACLIVLVLQTQHHLTGLAIVYNALYIFAGGAWYILLSGILYSLRPYKIIQQALGEYVMSVADYLKARGAFYDKGFSYEKNYTEVVTAQGVVQAQQAVVAEMLFKTRSIVKESTHTGRVLMMVFLDVSDIFEIVMTSHQDYEKLHSYFDETGILEEYRQLINSLSAELDKVGLALQSGRRSTHDEKIDEELLEERKQLQALRAEKMDAGNLEGFINLRHILDSIDELATRIRTLHQYTSYDKKLRRKKIEAPDAESFITHQSIDIQLLLDNLSFRSNIFRHSLRISAAALFAYIIAAFLPLGHSYWILLTVIVILKPGYSLTRQRNYERLTGTIIGTAMGALLIYLVDDKTTILIFLTVSMIGAYSFMRKSYLVSTILMTLYLLLMFHLLEPQGFRTLLAERILDTAIGSIIAFVFGYLFAPVWEHEQLNHYLDRVLGDVLRYYQLVSAPFTGKAFDKKQSVWVRKNSWVSLANLSDAFTRMLSEPKTKQKNAEYLHQMVVAIHMLNSHIATLTYYTDSLQPDYISEDYIPLINASTRSLEQAQRIIHGNGDESTVVKSDAAQLRLLDQRVNELVRKRQDEIRAGQMDTPTGKLLSTFKSISDQFYFIYKISGDVERISVKLSG
jgi:uncharacterized membrane protein (TIGR01666 family)